MTNKGPNIKLFDIETAPNLAHVWQFRKTNVGVNQVMEDGHIMSFAYKDLGEPYTYYCENRTEDDKQITEQLCAMLDEADIVIGHNARRFDVGWVRGKAAIHGLHPPSPFKVIDTWVETKKHMYLPNYSLAYLSRVFGLTEKLTHKNFPGHSLWTECLKGNPKAWKEMEEYNRQDVITTEELYEKIKPYISTHPNIGVYGNSDEPVCPKCGSSHVHFRGYAYTNLSKFRKFQCKDCGGWGRLRANELTKDQRKGLATNAL